MISITKLLCNSASYGDELRYKKDLRSSKRRPVVVWNMTRRCNLSCIHCYSDSCNKDYPGELSTKEAEALIADLSDFGVPVLLFSGGEPLLRDDLFQLASFAKSLGLRTVISTNGTLISESVAKRIKDTGFSYVGVSLDGVGKNNDTFRGKTGAFSKAVSGMRNLVKVGQRVGLRFTITRHNYSDLTSIFKLVEDENIDRVCFYHLVYAGRGGDMLKDDLSHEETRLCLDNICAWAKDLYSKGLEKEVLTVDNHTDGVYIYLKLKKDDPEKANAVLELLKTNGGNNSGIAFANIDNLGFVHADQFWQKYSFGNVRTKPFSQLWQDTSDKLLAGLRDRKPLLKGRCSRCSYLDLCNGNFRVRAEAVYNDVWAEDPACYLTEDEICNNGFEHSAAKA